MLDEIEKAHPEVFNILLQIFDDGHLTDAKGRKVDFRNSIIIMTSNIGSDLIKDDSSVGFTVKSDESKTTEQKYDRMKEKVMDEVKRFFRPEFINRIDGMVVFHTLSKEHIVQIVDLMLKQPHQALLEKGISLEITQPVKQWLAEKGYDPSYGARPLRRLIQDSVEDKLSEKLLAGDFGPGDTVVLNIQDDEIVVNTQVPASSSAS